jgi:succinate-semialdehyde dehydrogenase/glutarate-semialdehyde dehydrogenase
MADGEQESWRTNMKLKDQALFRQAAYVDGAWRAAAGGGVIAVKNPANGRLLGSVPDLIATEVEVAIAAAQRAFDPWRTLTGKERCALLRRWHGLIVEHSDDLARILTLENGKPLAEAHGEIRYALSFIDWFAEEARRTYGDVIPQTVADQRLFAIRQPVGVCAAITAWNFPSALITRKTAPALAAGCTVVVKPSELTPFSALALAELAHRAGIPAGVFNVVTGDAAAIGRCLSEHPTVRKLTFTGSSRVGRLLMQQCAGTVKRLSLELGGNAPFIVFADADIDRAIDGLMMSKFRNTGQTCVCANRVYVHGSIHAEFARRLVERVGALVVGDGFGPGVTQGPLINAPSLAKVQRLVDNAVELGARVAIGGRQHSLGGSFYEPTVLTGVKPNMDVASEEIFGPVIPLISFESDDEVIALANDSEAGLAGYFYSRDVARAWRVAEALECGIVGVNTGIVSNEVGPFGGVKQSGFGREGSKYGIDEFMDLKYVCLGNV